MHRDPSSSLRMGDLTRSSGLSSRAVRYYEQIGLIKPLGRTPGGYRLFHPQTLERLAFIRQAQSLGLSLEAIRNLLGARHKGDPRCLDARGQLKEKLAELERILIRIQGQCEKLRALNATCERCTDECLLREILPTLLPPGELA